MLKKIIDFILPPPRSDFNHLIEGVYADQYTDDRVRTEIAQAYQQRWNPESQPQTPATHPQLFDPLAPPPGWRYDAYYECWLKFGDAE